jgi:phage shock protein PspC (stress-responsive transcriptional regulator)
MDAYKKLYRTTDNRVFAGVAGGLAEYFGINPTLVRIAFILLFFFGGSGGFIYFLLWMLTPRRPSILISFDNDDIIERSDSFIGRFIKAGACAILLLIIGAIFSDNIWMAAFVVGLAIGLYWFFKSRESRSGDVADRTSLHRSTINKKVFGVFGGLAEMWNIDATILRVAGVVLVFAGAGVLVPIYFLMAILVPKSDVAEPVVERVVIV